MFLKFIPKQLWVALAASLLLLSLLYTTYSKGVSDERLANEKAKQDTINTLTEVGLSKAQKELEEALTLQQVKKQQVLTLNGQLQASERQSKALQEAIDELRNSPTGNSCTTLPESYIRVYEDLYGQRPQD